MLAFIKTLMDLSTREAPPKINMKKTLLTMEKWKLVKLNKGCKTKKAK